jgi:hypothetical protein
MILMMILTEVSTLVNVRASLATLTGVKSAPRPWALRPYTIDSRSELQQSL